MGLIQKEAQQLGIYWTEKRLSILLDIFFEEYLRAPNNAEFETMTGTLGKIIRAYGSYGNFLKQNRFMKPETRKTYNVINDRGALIYTGTADDIADEFDITVQHVHKCIRHNNKLKSIYVLKLKPFNEADIINQIRKEIFITGGEK